ncbi:MAG: hypothetical protein ABJB66_00010 [Gemmatimonadaceae bacterium]
MTIRSIPACAFTSKDMFDLVQALRGLPARPDATHGQTNFGWLMEQHLLAMNFTVPAALAIAHAACVWFPGMVADVLALPSMVEDVLQNANNRKFLRLSIKNGKKLVASLQMMSPTQLSAVVSAARQANSLVDTSETCLGLVDALRAVHLVSTKN